MKKYLKWIFSDLVLNKRFTILFVLNLSLGLVGFVTLDSFRNSLESSMTANSRAIMGADLSIRSRSKISKEQLMATQRVLGDAPTAQVIETYSMVANDDSDSRLIQIKAIDQSFPFYGGINLQRAGLVNSNSPYDILNNKVAWVYPEVLAQLNLEIGDSILVGNTSFIISDVVLDDSAASFNTTMAPRIYIGLAYLEDTRLITAESLAWYSYLFYKPLGDDQLQEISNKIFNQPEITESIRVNIHSSSSEQMNRMLGYLNDYLGLVSIAAIFLASIGASFLFRSYINQKISQIAIFRSLGMSFSKTISIYIIQVLVLGLLASAISFVAALVLTPLLKALLADLSAIKISLDVRWQGVVVAFSLGIFGSLLICSPILVKLKEIKPSQLFKSSQIRLKENIYSFALYAFSLFLLWGLAVWQANSWKIGTVFIVVFLVSGLFLAAAAYVSFKLFDRFGKHFPLSLRMAWRSLARQPLHSLSCFLALGLGLSLLNVIPQIEASLQKELAQPESSKLPSLFMFDIQDTQLSEFKDAVDQNGARLSLVSPMVRSRLLKVNDKDFERANAGEESFSREDQREARFRNRGFNLSYRNELDASESIIKGSGFSGVYNADKNPIAEVSVETRFADRLDLKLGDVLEFEVQGVPVLAKIVNLRSVRWTSFQPNFFLQFQPGVLEEAPKTHIATVESMPKAEAISLQNAIVKKFPNISIIDVTRMVKRISDISKQMSTAMQFMAILCLAVGFLVVYSIASHQASSRKQDINLIKVLGAPIATIRKLFLYEFVTLAIYASLLGVFISMVISYGFSILLFDSIWNWSSLTPLLSLLATVLLVLVLANLTISKVIQRRASFYLK